MIVRRVTYVCDRCEHREPALCRQTIRDHIPPVGWVELTDVGKDSEPPSHLCPACVAVIAADFVLPKLARG